MKLSEIKAIEQETLDALRKRNLEQNDNDAARVILEHLRDSSEVISNWKIQKDALEARKKPKL